MVHREYSPLDMFMIIDPKGKVVNKKYEPKLPKDDLLKLYKYMLLARLADDKALAMQRTGRMGTYGGPRGEEASQAGPALAINKDDWVFPSYREMVISTMLGIPLSAYYLYYMGNEEGSQIPDNTNFFTVSIPVGTQMLHAVGTGIANNYLKEKKVALAFFGDGATSEGDFHEAMNFAGVYKTPTVFICRNNQYAISLPRSQQTASQTIAQKALAYGFHGLLVDGNDVLAMYVVTKQAVDRARKGEGPTLIEAFTYRLGPHTTADDPTVYRSKKETSEWAKKDPLIRFEAYLKTKKVLTSAKKKEITSWCIDEIAKAVKDAEAAPKSTIDNLFDYVYAECPPNLEEQKAYLKQYVKETKPENTPSNEELRNKEVPTEIEQTTETEKEISTEKPKVSKKIKKSTKKVAKKPIKKRAKK